MNLQEKQLNISSLNQQQKAANQASVQLSDIALPLAILSIDDGIVVYANEEFKKIIKSAQVGQTIKGFLNTEKKRTFINKKLLTTNKVVSTYDTSKYTLKFSVTNSHFADENHYIVALEKLVKTEQTESLEQADDQVKSDLSILDKNSSRKSYTGYLAKLLTSQDDAGEEVCVCSIDIDRFKIVNEKYGYEAGDYVLQKTAQLINNNISCRHYISRIGDNEFGLVLEGVNIDEAVQICEVIREQLKSEQFIHNDEPISITTSIGVIAIDRQKDSVEEILTQSTLALSAAQENGRDCVHSSATQDTMMAYHSGKMHYAMVIEDALKNNKFELFAQPIVNLENPDNHYSYEVLLRIYDHKKEEYISSQELISAAESLEVTTRIDRYVCEKVFKLLSEKAKEQIRVPNISVNLSGHSIVSVAFQKFLLELTAEYNVPTSCVCFEITESVAVKSISRAQNFIKNLKQVGYRFSLDDFGVGYCSFNYLNQLNVDNVKIDGSFVSAMLDDATQFATVHLLG